ncbi:MAG: hypothetical protein DVB33_03665 [Verrucomicrobia bacterium]|jgi:uncharacterized membrane protein|nr:MAG: hypothetical protein DVB33_03665 [Verrucomicrobiota bacterium]
MIEFIGKFHPLFVHLPIGFFTLLGVFELLALRPNWKQLASANRVILLLTIPASLASVVCGWLLARGQEESSTLFWHRWLGTGVAAAAILLWIVRQRGWLRAYRRCLFGTYILLTVASHNGGSITHGENFLSWPRNPAPVKPLSNAELLAQPAYKTVIQPIFDKYCVSCHGTTKSKGALRMDTAEQLLKGGDSGSCLDPANAEESLLGKRVALPNDDDDHMPPDGKPQLSESQLAVLRWWLNAGAPTDKALGELKPTAEILVSIQTSLATPAPKGVEVQ